MRAQRIHAGHHAGFGAAKEDAHALVTLVLGNRAKEVPERGTLAPAYCRRNSESATLDRQRRVRRNDVDVVGLDGHRLRGFQHR